VSRGQRGGSPTVVNLSFLDRSSYFSLESNNSNVKRVYSQSRDRAKNVLWEGLRNPFRLFEVFLRLHCLSFKHARTHAHTQTEHTALSARLFCREAEPHKITRPVCHFIRKQLKVIQLTSAQSGVSFVRFEVFTAVTMKNGVFWVVTPCGSCKNRRFRGTWRLLHQGDKNRLTRNNTSCN
jgi:hypothetical protein